MATVTGSPKTDESRTDYQFTLVLAGLKEMPEELAEAIYGAGCNDAIIGSANGEVYLDFDREADSHVEAILSAIQQVESCGVRVRAVRPPGAVEINMLNNWLEIRTQLPKEKVDEYIDVLNFFKHER